MKITKELVIAFFEDRCSKEEAEAIHWYLQENPGLLHDFFPEEEWTGFQVTEGLPGGLSENVWKKIQAGKTPVTGRVRTLFVIKVAASVVLIAAGIFVFKQFPGGKTELHATLAVAAPAESRDTVLTNRTAKPWKAVLTDGSVVELSPASTLILRWNFEQGKRSVRLLGEALFNVAREKQRPFTVITRGFTTTVLGTVFRIRAYADKKLASVRLLSGKVMVKNLTHPSQVTTLIPGQECTFDNSKNSLTRAAAALRPVMPSHAPEPEIDNLADSSSEITDKQILFKNLPLPRVLAILSETYHTSIQFTNADLRRRKFTGSIQKDQSLEDALNTIAQLNDLLFTRQDGAYRITLRQ